MNRILTAVNNSYITENWVIFFHELTELTNGLHNYHYEALMNRLSVMKTPIGTQTVFNTNAWADETGRKVVFYDENNAS